MYYVIILLIIILEAQFNLHGRLAVAGLVIILLVDWYQKWRVMKWVDKGFKPQIPFTSSPLDQIVARLKKERNRSRKWKKRLQQFITAYREIVEEVPEAAFIVDKRNLLLSINKHARTMLNLNKRLDIGVSIDHLLRGEDVPAFSKAMQNNVRLYMRLINSNNQTWLEFSKIPLANDNTLYLARDVSDQMQLDVKRKVFIDNASHELKTPITVIKGYLDILETQSLPENVNEHIAEMQRQTKQLQSLVEDMLQLSRLEHSKSNLQESIVELHRFLQSCVEDILIAYPNKISIEINRIEENISLIIDEKIMETVIKNLLENAILYSGSKDPITISAELLDSGLFIDITDKGIGIATQHIKRITQRFYRVDSTRSLAQGSGLGLSIVKHGIEVHGGSLNIESELGEGSTFTLFLPITHIKQSV